MAQEVSLLQYLAAENVQLASWGETEVLRLEMAMDYSLPFLCPGTNGAVGSAAIRWSTLSNEFGNGLSATASGTRAAQAVLIALLYSKILVIQPVNRCTLFVEVQNAVNRCEETGDWSCLSFEPCYLSGTTVAGSFQQVVWPWEIAAWSEIEARRPQAVVDVGGTKKCMSKTYTATLLRGPVTDCAPQGWWLRLGIPDLELMRALLPAAPLIAITEFMNEPNDEAQQFLSTLLSRINWYYLAPDNVGFGREAMAVRAAFRTIASPGEGDIGYYRREDDAILAKKQQPGQETAQETAQEEGKNPIRSLFRNRSWGWWIGCVVGFVCAVLFQGLTNRNPDKLTMLGGVLLGGVTGEWVGSQIRRLTHSG
jgi:hypothetical protein